MTTYISELAVSLNKVDEQNLRDRIFKQLPGNLNKGAGGNNIYLWYKNGPKAITRLQVSFKADMTPGLISAGYTKINKDLNAGVGGDQIYLWYYKGSGEYDTPIVDIDVTTDANNEAAKFQIGYERLACDLNRAAGGAWIHIWMKREKQTYICDVTATNSYGADAYLFGNSFIRMDEDTSRGAGGSYVFIWYRQTTDPKRALTDLQVSTTKDEERSYQQRDYKSVNVNLNDGNCGSIVYLWFKKEGSNNPIKAIALLVNTALIPEYLKAGVIVIERNLNSGNRGWIEYLCVYQ
ncbi:uncharacterized protein LOC129107469 [Anoplopoma fimbria]|uniref:uncharacterized protein LOC129107469 n=1 Tax=Anoplopoma fimbria TaxID=229290 RepID=UPI0023EB1B85|nr:uncharacterized protein LOC129107469 [Anoplopoma fimbria]